MTRLFSPQDTQRPDGAYAVRRPRATDPIGESLRRIFGEEARLPAEIDRALRALDRIP